MPTYEYACTLCGHKFEAIQSFTDAALTQCPECDGLVQKVYSNVGVVFKGSGFYKTDSRKTKSESSTSATTPATPVAPAATATPTSTAKKD
jgi:putative FmdB family regulatory protein